MNGKTILTATGVVLAAILLGAIANAIVQTYYSFPQTANVSVPSAKFYLHGELWLNNTEIVWDGLAPETQYSYDFTIENTSPYPITATLVISGLPAGWTETWGTGSYTIGIGATETYPLILNVPSVIPGSYHWSTSVTIEPD